uniref:Uncharacterized protein n=1 Tax=Strombidium rassoulzadegani TaxID=1082188 RepID=A0A7S3CTZ0_9SPIT|mmetsp:Transcript_8551/g.14425  ORF Transcript_8551/g.14425 Transcript_8551/m.14425 type:complete len:301 (+) Transcript_8551:246-1148(+)
MRHSKPPSYASELTLVIVNMFLLKFYSERFFDAMSFFNISVPMLGYLICTLFTNLMEFIKLLHIEDSDSESIISPKQQKLLTRIVRDLAAYFGIYYISDKFDQILTFKEDALDPLPQDASFIFAIALIELALVIQVLVMRHKRSQIIKAQVAAGMIDEKTASQSVFSAAGLTTLFNALTQTTTTLCANGQCFTIYSNTIASNLAAFGVTVTSISTVLIPLCLCLLSYSVWCLYKEKRDCTYRPFLLGLTGSALIVFDNFLFGEQLNLRNIPSWIGNGALVVASLWAAKDNQKDKSSPFGV